MQKRKKQPCTKQDKTIWRLKDWETVARCISAIQASKCQVSMRVCHQIAEFYCSPSIFIPRSLLNDFSDFPSYDYSCCIQKFTISPFISIYHVVSSKLLWMYTLPSSMGLFRYISIRVVCSIGACVYVLSILVGMFYVI